MNTSRLNQRHTQHIGRKRTTACFAIAMLVSCLAVPAALKVGDEFPQLDRFNLEGPVPPALAGKVVLLDFWASWCGPCKQSFPALNQIHKQFTSRGVVVIGVSVDEHRGAMERFLKATPASFPIVRDGAQKLVAALDAETMPTTVILDAAGRIRFVHRGYHGDATRADYEKELEQLLKEKK